ncbi:MAG: Tm-1-like ATP-binding domain-containing protein, partial [Planctomycetia bacterium]
FLFPSKGVSGIDRAGQPFDDPAARAALLAGFKETHGTVPLEVREEHINDASFAEAAARDLLRMMGRG